MLPAVGLPRRCGQGSTGPVLDRELPPPAGRMEVLAQAGRVRHPPGEARPQLQAPRPGNTTGPTHTHLAYSSGESKMFIHTHTHTHRRIIQTGTHTNIEFVSHVFVSSHLYIAELSVNSAVVAKTVNPS